METKCLISISYMEQIKASLEKIEAEVKRTQVNKATEYHLGQLRAKQSKLIKKLEEMKSQPQQRKIGSSKLQIQPKSFNPRELLNRMQNFNNEVQQPEKELTLTSFFFDSNENQASYLQKQDKITGNIQELIIYVSRFSQNETVKNFGNEAFQRIYNQFEPDYRKAHLIETVLPLIIKLINQIDVDDDKNNEICMLLIQSLIPFCTVNAKKDKLLRIFIHIQQNSHFESIKPSVEKAIMLLSN